MPFGDFVNQIPPIGFLAIHIKDAARIFGENGGHQCDQLAGIIVATVTHNRFERIRGCHRCAKSQ